jgi:hypothetical protein
MLTYIVCYHLKDITEEQKNKAIDILLKERYFTGLQRAFFKLNNKQK